jgi:hypothetical protein
MNLLIDAFHPLEAWLGLESIKARLQRVREEVATDGTSVSVVVSARGDPAGPELARSMVSANVGGSCSIPADRSNYDKLLTLGVHQQSQEANGAVHGFDVRNPLWPREVARVALGDVILTSVGGFVFGGTRGFAFGGVARGLLELDFAQPRNVVLTTAADRALQF